MPLHQERPDTFGPAPGGPPGVGGRLMARLPLVPDDGADPVTQAVFGRSRAEGREPIALYRVLANNPEVLEAYAALARAVRFSATTDRALRELVILRVACLAGSDYEWAHHVAMAAAAGVPAEQIDAVGGWRSSAAFDPHEGAALALADEVHALAVTDDTFAAAVAELGANGAYEVVLTASLYEAVARVLQGFDLAVDDAYLPHLQRHPRPEPR